MFNQQAGGSSGPARSRLGEGDAGPADPRRALTSMGAVVYDWNVSSDRITWGANADDVLGIPGIALAGGREFSNVVVPMAGATRADAIVGAQERDEGSGVAYAVSYGIRTGTGRFVAVDDTGRWYADATGKPVRAHGVMRLRPAEPVEFELSRTRADFLAQAAVDLAEAAADKRGLTLFALAIANLPELNDELGFDEADTVIQTVLARLHATTRQRDRFARYSGNRFAVLLRGCDLGQAGVAAERVLRLVCGEKVGTSHGAVEVRLVIGGASAPDHATDADALLRRAEGSLGLAKRRAGVSFLMHDPKLFRQSARREPLLDCLDILNARRIALACQPVVEATTREPSFHEALLRVETADGRFEVAGDIIPALERGGLVHLADTRMIELAVEQLAADPAARIAVNVSPMTLDKDDWLAVLSGHVGARPGIASRLIVEVTETAAVRDPDGIRRILDATKALGVTIAIDDFGAGHTSFRSLRNFPVDLVKIDGAFVQNLPRSPDDRFFVRTLVDLAHHLGIATVAEWVEDEDTAQLLASWGVDFLQGDHCGRPQIIAGRRGLGREARAGDASRAA